MLPIDDFRHIVRNTPLIAIDLVLIDEGNKVLLGKRRNMPAQGYWFVPGGRIYKNELIKTAIKRISQEELGIDLSIEEAEFKGVYEHLYSENFTGTKEFDTHYVIIAYSLSFNVPIINLPVIQHNDYKFFSIESLLMNNKVHQYTKDYFR